MTDIWRSTPDAVDILVNKNDLENVRTILRELNLLQGYGRKENYTTELLQKFDFYFLPVVNPDGYEYSFKKDRLWRKSRKYESISGCHGIDLNRNWRFHWGEFYSSDDPCSTIYQGRSPEDAIEVLNIVNFLSPRAHSFVAFLTYHSYGQRFITRWDYSKDVIPSDHSHLINVAQRAVRAMNEVHGKVYEAGRAPELMYPYGGGSPDWARAIANIKYSYLIELRDRHSFILPEREIIPTGEENWAALVVILEEIFSNNIAASAPKISYLPCCLRDNVKYQTYKVGEVNYSTLFDTEHNSSQLYAMSIFPLAMLMACYIETCFG
ncbi:hypothetical protein LSH36_786g00042 [Paralvinella palmiformis]|uniref:Peptidase M14 domain-containing protein n=1 Tax=Paralvinella palmiformis TaxID=53620 RepID=A0AAD9MSS3_9ANNE|nr:hypothetical protein LSH36_786g00042 [Paralvinella palmiformis]